VSRRRLLLLFLAVAPAACGRRGQLRLPSREGGGGDTGPTPTAPPAGSAPQRRGPTPAGLETG
jgi:predicted small lipoprotein YifL